MRSGTAGRNHTARASTTGRCINGSSARGRRDRRTGTAGRNLTARAPTTGQCICIHGSIRRKGRA
jgi:hypothetical protein